MTDEKLTFLPRADDQYFVLLGNRNLGSILRKTRIHINGQTTEKGPYEFCRERHYVSGYDDQIKAQLIHLNVVLRLKGTP